MKKLLVLAIVYALSMPFVANADTANTTVYGSFNVAAEFTKAGNPPDAYSGYAGRMRMGSYSSNIGFKGSEDIIEGLKGIFQVEANLDVAAGTWDGAASKLRNTGLGLEGGFGKLIFGHWDNPYKTATSFADPFYGAPGWISGGWDGTTLAIRKANSINYWTPKFAGVGIQLQYAPPTSSGALNTPMYDSHLGAALTFAEGPLSAGFAYQTINKDDNTTRTTGIKAAIGFKPMDTTSLNVGYVTYGTKVKATDITNDKKNSILVSLSHRIDDFIIRGAYATTGKEKDNDVEVDNSQFAQLSAGVGYAVSKRTEIYTTYWQIMNGDAANARFAINPVNGSTALAVGSDPAALSIGVKHSF